MTSVISKVPAALAYLADLFAAASTLGTATPPVAVYDGPQATAAVSQLTLWVGLDDPDGGTLAATSERYWSGLGGQGELITIPCAAEAWSGEEGIRAQRAAAYQIAAAAEALVRADATQFGGNGLTADPGVTASELHQDNTDQGPLARVTFQIVLRAL